jgi:FAD/FMN-containing dehydrogenase
MSKAPTAACSAACSISAPPRPDEIRARFPDVLRRVGGYNVDALVPGGGPVNLAHLLVGSEGTLAISTQLELKLSPLISNKVFGVCHFARFYDAMDAAQHIVKLDPTAVELVDRTMIELARDIAIFRPLSNASCAARRTPC